MPESRLPIITLTTDFGTADHYVGAVKAAILSVTTQVVIVDITHEIPAHDILQAGWVIRNAFDTFPPRTVHVVVTDPGVGTARRPILAVTGKYFFVGPDNGIFSFVFDVEPPRMVVEISAPQYIRPRVSATFHARDIFGPVAAHLTRGNDPATFGAPVEDPARLEIARPKVEQDGSIHATVVRVDRFGNAVLNVTRKAMEAFLERTKAAGFAARAGRSTIARTQRTYGEATDDQPFLLYNSSDFLEIAANRARAADLLGIGPGSRVDLILTEK